MIGTGLVAALIASFMSTYLMGKTVPFTFCHSLWHECLRRCPASGTHHEVTPDDGRKKRLENELGP